MNVALGEGIIFQDVFVAPSAFATIGLGENSSDWTEY